MGCRCAKFGTPMLQNEANAQAAPNVTIVDGERTRPVLPAGVYKCRGLCALESKLGSLADLRRE
eukprot:2465105-Pleurochrysis_carterae.AAC.1